MKQNFLLTLALLSTPMAGMLNEKHKKPLEKITKSFKMRNQLQLKKSNLLNENKLNKITLDDYEGRDLYLALKASETTFCSKSAISQNITDAANKIVKLDNRGAFSLCILGINFNCLFTALAGIPMNDFSTNGHFLFLLTASLIGGSYYLSHIAQKTKVLNRYVSEQKDNELALNLIENYKNQLHNYYGSVLVSWPNNPLKIKTFYDIIFE